VLWWFPGAFDVRFMSLMELYLRIKFSKDADAGFWAWNLGRTCPSIVVPSSSLVCCYWGGQHICPFGHNGESGFAPAKFHLLLAGTNL